MHTFYHCTWNCTQPTSMPKLELQRSFDAAHLLHSSLNQAKFLRSMFSVCSFASWHTKSHTTTENDEMFERGTTTHTLTSERLQNSIRSSSFKFIWYGRTFCLDSFAIKFNDCLQSFVNMYDSTTGHPPQTNINDSV